MTRERSLRDAWAAHAEEWVGWARSEHADATTWRLGLPALLAVVPAPGRLTVDLGCGEGRVGRALLARGHRVLGVEPVAALARAARAGDPPLDVVVADGAALPLADAQADAVVAGMVLQSVDDLGAVVREAARVLAPGGALCASVVHPLRSRERVPSYFAEQRVTDTRSRAGATMTFHDVHRPLSAYAAALTDAGLVIDRLDEPVPDDALVRDRPDLARWRADPRLLVLRAVKPAAAAAVAASQPPAPGPTSPS